MGKPRACTLIAQFAAATLIGAGGSAGQEVLSARLERSGLIRVFQGKTELAMIELNAHGPEWKHAPQETATATIDPLPGDAGRKVTGTLPIPNTNGGVLQFTEMVKALPNGLALEYEVRADAATRLNGLQVSICLPVAQYAGQEIEIPQMEGETEIVGLPAQQRPAFQIWAGEGAKVHVAKDTPKALTAELRAPTDVVIQDLRQWEHDIYEIRFPAIMQDEGRDVVAGEAFHLELTLTFPEAIRLSEQ